jgi:hypothetical protein
MRGANVSLVALALAAGLWTIGEAAPAAAQNYGQNQQGSGLTARPSPAASDIIPCQPVGLSTQGCTAGGIAALWGGATLVCTGVATTDTAAIQAAITAGVAVIQLAPGTCVASGLTSPNPAIGQIIRGAGEGLTVIKPPSGSTGFVLTTGTSSSYAPGWSIQDLTIDLTNMSDVSTNGAINQQGVYGAQYIAVAVINDGANKRAWLFNNGAELSGLYDTLGNILDFEGVAGGSNDNPTTIDVIGHNGGHAIMSWANGIHFIGGAFQGTSVTHFAIANSGDINVSTDVEGSGAYVTCAAFTYAIRLHSELGGLTGAAEPTGCGLNSEIEDDKPSDQNYASTYRSWAGDQLNGHGASAFSRYLSGAAGYDYSLQLGRTGADTGFAVAGSTNDWGTGTAAGDGVLYTNGSSSCIWLSPYFLPALEACPGALTFIKPIASAIWKPATDGQYVTFENAAGSAFLLMRSSATIGSSDVAVGNGSALNGFSDSAFSTKTFALNSASGQANFESAVLQPFTDGQALIVNNAEGTGVAVLATSSTAANSTWSIGRGAKITGWSDAFSTQTYQLDAATGTANFDYYQAAGTAGITCSGAPTSSFASKNGIVTHC